MYKPGQQIEKYEVIQSLGGGHFGTVYRVRDLALSREIAIKLISTTNADALKNLVEAQAQYLCQHDNCVQVMSANVVDLHGQMTVIIEMEYVPAGSLQAQMSARFLSCKESVHHMRQVLYALEHAHAKGILHRDVKPGNILLADPHTKLSDFGIAYDLSRPNAGYNLVYQSHASPQIAAGNAPLRSDDVFSAGMTLFRLLNNYANWRATRQKIPDWKKAIQAGSLMKQIGFHSHVPMRLRRVIQRACHADSAKRFATCIEFRQALEKLRFSSAWIQTAPGMWVAGNQTITVTGLKVEHRIGSRRRRANCRHFGTPADACEFAAGLVRESTLE